MYISIDTVPRLIDTQQREADIVEAAWRVLVRDGIRAVSVRNVAAEAGLATASLRRSFPSQSELLAACLTLIGDRAEARISALPATGDPVEDAVAVLSETLPLDERRRLEMHVYLTLGTAALSDPTLGSAYRTTSNELARLCARMVDLLMPDGSEPDRGRESAHLYAVVDGLALHTLHGDEPAAAVEILREHMIRLR